ncbi:hypothetical protein C8R44DRAFT_876612 [Mycena epipterygia]|nr:hypothetical protein C8R44DRAFT_876612 [Mycena epipterygia]
MENRPVEYLRGPWLIGTCIDLLFQGILSAQFVKYFAVFRSDPTALKIFVGILAVLTYLRSIQVFTLVWFQVILHFGDMAWSFNCYWWLDTGALLGATIGLCVQAYFCSRLYLISDKNAYIVAPICAVFLFAYAAVIVVTRYLLAGPQYIQNIIQWFSIHLPAVMAGDILLTSSTAYFLIKKKNQAMPHTVGVLNALIRLTFQTAAPATICALINFVMNQTFPEEFPGARGAAAAAANEALPKLYAFSMMWTLNGRTDIRMMLVPSVIESTSGVDFRSTQRHVRYCDAEQGIRQLMSQGSVLAFETSQGRAAPKIARFSMARSDAVTMSEGSDAGLQSGEMVFASRGRSEI